MSELVVLVGLPGSGKSSFHRSRFAATHACVSKDLMRSARNKDARQLRLVGEALGAGGSAVVDNTNPRPEDRAPLLALARAHGARAVAYFFDADPRECIARNAARAGRARVPAVAIWATHRRLTPPSVDEGFDAVYRVRLAGGDFAVEPITGRGPA